MGSLYQVRNKVREKIRDLNPATPALLDHTINRYIEDALHGVIAPQVRPGETWTAAAVTLVAGTSDYTMSGVQYAQVRELKLDSLGLPLERKSFAEIEAYRQGATIGSGDPQFYFMWEDQYGLIHLRLYPTPDAADTLSRFASVIPAVLHEDVWAVSSGTVSTTSITTTVDKFNMVKVNDVVGGKLPSSFSDGTYVTVVAATSLTISSAILASFAKTRLNFSSPIPLPEPALRALEAEAAAMCIDSMTAAQLEKLALNPKLSDSLRAQSKEAIYWEKVRRSRQQTTETVARGW